MTDRYVKNVTLQAVPEVSYAAASTFLNTGGVALVELPDVTWDSVNHDRQRHDRFFGSSEHLPAAELFKIKFKTELTPSGAPGVVPPAGVLLRACGFHEEITVGSRVTYTPRSEGLGSVGLNWGQSGVRHTVRGSRGKVSIAFEVGKPVMAEWEFWGFGRAPITASLPNLDLSAWLTPQVIKPDNASKLLFGPTLAANGTLTGGTVTRMRSARIMIDNSLEHLMYSDDELIGISDRQISGSVELGLTAEEERQLIADVRAVTTSSMAITHGTTAGNILQIAGARVQRINPKMVNYKGNLMISADTRWLPNGGDNDIILTFR